MGELLFPLILVLFLFCECQCEQVNEFDKNLNCYKNFKKDYFPGETFIQYENSEIMDILHESILDINFLNGLSYLDPLNDHFLAHSPTVCLTHGVLYTISTAQSWVSDCVYTDTILLGDDSFNYHCRHEGRLITYASCRVMIIAISKITAKEFVEPSTDGLQTLTTNSSHWFFTGIQQQVDPGCRCQNSVDTRLISSLKSELQHLVEQIIFLMDRYEPPNMDFFQLSYISIPKPDEILEQKIFYNYLCKYYDMKPCLYPSRDISANALSPDQQTYYNKILQTYFCFSNKTCLPNVQQREKRAVFSFLESQSNADVSEVQHRTAVNRQNLNKILMLARESRNRQDSLDQSLKLTKIDTASHNSFLQKLSSHVVLSNLNIFHLARRDQLKTQLTLIYNSLSRNKKEVRAHLHHLLPTGLLSCSFNDTIFCGNETDLIYDSTAGNFLLQNKQTKFHLENSLSFSCLPKFENNSFTLHHLHLRKFKTAEINITELQSSEYCEDDLFDQSLCNSTVVSPASYSVANKRFFYIPVIGGFWLNSNETFYLLDKRQMPYLVSTIPIFIKAGQFPIEYNQYEVTIQHLIKNFNVYRNQSIYGMANRKHNYILQTDTEIRNNIFAKIPELEDDDFTLTQYTEVPMTEWRNTQRFYFYSALIFFSILGLAIIIGFIKLCCCIFTCKCCKGS